MNNSRIWMLCGILCLATDIAWAITIGPAQTKRERQGQRTPSASVRTPNGVTFEQIEESYLKEDFASVERLSAQYLASNGNGFRAPDVRFRRDVALIKLGGGISASNASSIAAPSPLKQLAVEESLIYCVQVGSFSRRQNAERMLNRLLRNRYDAYMSRDTASKLFRVRVGHLSTSQEAQNMESKLKKDGYPTRIFP